MNRRATKTLQCSNDEFIFIARLSAMTVIIFSIALVATFLALLLSHVQCYHLASKSPYVYKRRLQTISSSSSSLFCNAATAAAAASELPLASSATPPILPNKNAIQTFLNNRKDGINRLSSTLSSLGSSGILSYGLLNFVYYTVVTLIAWILTGKKYSNEKILIRLSKVSSSVWLGSQVTKAFRITGAIVLAPAIDQFMTKMQKYFNISRNKCFWILTSGIWISMAAFYLLLISTAYFRRKVVPF